MRAENAASASPSGRSAAHLRAVGRRAPGNARYLVADAHALPREWHGLATHRTINFP